MITITDVAACRRRRARDGVAGAERIGDGLGRAGRAGPGRRRRARLPAVGPGPRAAPPAHQVWAAIIADIENPFFTAVVRGIEDVARRRGPPARAVQLRRGPRRRRPRTSTSCVAERMAGVVIAVASTRRVDARRRCSMRGIPVVAVDRRPAHARGRLGGRRQPARRATGDRAPRSTAARDASRASPARLGSSTASERLRRLPATRSRGAGARSDAALVRRADFKEEGGYRAARSLLEAAAPPDALFVANNLMTVGALRALRERGPAGPRRRARSSASTTRRWTTLVSPAAHRRRPADLRDRPARPALAGYGGRSGERPARRAARRRSSCGRARCGPAPSRPPGCLEIDFAHVRGCDPPRTCEAR